MLYRIQSEPIRQTTYIYRGDLEFPATNTCETTYRVVSNRTATVVVEGITNSFILSSLALFDFKTTERVVVNLITNDYTLRREIIQPATNGIMYISGVITNVRK